MFSRFGLGLILLPVLVCSAAPDTKLISLNLVAVDSNEQPVTDLRPDELRVTDDGKNEPIVFFRHVNDQGTAPFPAAAGEFSNGGRANARHATVILLDLLNHHVSTEMYAVDQTVRALSGMKNADDLYLYALGLDGKIIPLHGLDGAEIGATPQEAAQKEAWTLRIKSLTDTAMRTLEKVRPSDTNIINVRVDLTLKAMQDLATQLSTIPGRKNVVWITDGIPATITAVRSQTGHAIDFTTQLRQLGERFVRSGIVIYPVRQFLLGSSDAENGDLPSIQAISDLTGVTGGRPDSGNEIGHALQQAMRDLRSYYQVGYFPTEGNFDDKFHELHVACTRKGVQLETRTGYLALKEPDNAPADRATGEALKTRNEAADIGLRARVTPDPKAPQQTDVALRIAANDVTLVQDGPRYTGQLRLTIVLYRKDGNAMGLATVPMKLDYDVAQRNKALQDGIELNRRLNLEGVALIRAVAFDYGTGRVGSLAIPLDPDVAASLRVKDK